MISLMIKPVSSSCNLKCQYCFYRDEEEHRKKRLRKIMKLETVDHIVHFIKEDVSVVFQGGEPTLAGLEFFKYFTHALEKTPYLPYFSIQTNGLLIDEEWCRFFKLHDYLVGLSLDGPKEIQEANRPGSYDAAMHALSLLKQYEIDYSILCVVNKKNCHSARKVYEFFKDQGITTMQFIPCLNSLENKEELSAEEYGYFLNELFDLWKEDLNNCKNISIRYFENILRIMLGMGEESCGFGKCTHQYVVEANGDLYPCDFYCLDEYRIGNMDKKEIWTEKEKDFTKNFVSKECLACPYYRLCKGGCKRDYVDGKNRLCKSYRMFFEHSYNDLLTIRDSLRKQM